MIDTKELRQVLGAVSPEEVEELLDRLEAAEKERDWNAERLEEAIEELKALRAKIEAMERQEPSHGWWDDLIADISAINCMYRGSPTHAHDAYWMRDRVVWMLKQRRDSTPGAKGEAKMKLFCDCKTDEEKSNFFLSGRAVETGVIAPAISNEVAMAYHRCAQFKKENDALRAMLMDVLDVLEAVKGNINPERGYADELEVDVERAIAAISLYNARGNEK